MDYSGYHRYIDEHLPSENPSLYGLHPNIELECLTVTSNNVIRILLELQPQNFFRAEGEALSKEEKVCTQEETILEKNQATYINNFAMFYCIFQVKCVIEDILEKLPEEYNMAEMITKTTERNPYVSVCLQECEHMNLLLAEIRKSLTELNLSMKV